MRNRVRFYELGLCVKSYGFWKGLVLFIKLKLKKTQSINVADARYPISLRNGSSDQLVFKQVFLLKEYDLDQDFGMPVPSDIKVIIDAGANIGLASVYFANRYPNAKVIAIEPENGNFAQLKKNTAPYTNVIPLQAALWHEKDELIINNPDSSDWGFMVEQNTSKKAGAVPALSVADLMEQYNIKSIDLLKIDIEGAEKEVFEFGAEKWLPHAKTIVVELHDRMKPGCSRVFFEAIKKENFSLLVSGENLICVRA